MSKINGKEELQKFIQLTWDEFYLENKEELDKAAIQYALTGRMMINIVWDEEKEKPVLRILE